VFITTKTRLLYSANPNAKCAVTKTACSFSVITVAPNAIWPKTTAEATIEKTLVDLTEFLLLSTNIMVIKTKSPVDAAMVLWAYSIRNSGDGTNPCGHNGQSGHDKPTPLALTYPPINIKPNKTHSVTIENKRTNLS
jgi:hypothetical protein